MPRQKDFKRLVRSRMKKTGEAYTAARLQLLEKNEPAPDYAALAGLSDASVMKQTGRTWAEWLRILDATGAAEKSHRDIAAHISSLGTPSWWSQMVAVGYERIRGLRDRGQQRDGGYNASRSRTFNVSVEQLFKAFADARARKRWLDVKVTVRSATQPKRMRVTWPDGTNVVIGFIAKTSSKSVVAVAHERLPTKSAAEAMKKAWGEHFDRLAQFLG